GERSLLYGYPAREKSWDVDRAEGTIRPSSLPYLSDILKVSPERLIVKLNRKRCLREGGPIQEIGKLNGISGGGVFVLRNDSPHLAGIVIEHHSKTSEVICISSTVIGAMAARIAEFHSQPLAHESRS